MNGFSELTTYNTERFRRETNAALNGHTSIEIDLSQTTILDCSGLGALIALRNYARHRDSIIRLMSPTPAVRRLLKIARAEQMFEIVHAAGLDPMAHSQPGVYLAEQPMKSTEGSTTK